MKYTFGLFVILFGSVAFGQKATPREPETHPKYIVEYGPLNVDPLKLHIDHLFTALNIDRKTKGLIINYGTNKEIAKRKAKIIRAIKFRRYDLNRVKFLSRFSRKKIKTRIYTIDAAGKLIPFLLKVTEIDVRQN